MPGQETTEIRSPFKLEDLNVDAAKCEGCDGPMAGKLRQYLYIAGGFRFKADKVPALTCVTEREPNCGGDWYPWEVSVAMNKQVIMSLQLRGEQKLAHQVQLRGRKITEALAVKRSGLMRLSSQK